MAVRQIIPQLQNPGDAFANALPQIGAQVGSALMSTLGPGGTRETEKNIDGIKQDLISDIKTRGPESGLSDQDVNSAIAVVERTNDQAQLMQMWNEKQKDFEEQQGRMDLLEKMTGSREGPFGGLQGEAPQAPGQAPQAAAPASAPQAAGPVGAAPPPATPFDQAAMGAGSAIGSVATPVDPEMVYWKDRMSPAQWDNIVMRLSTDRNYTDPWPDINKAVQQHEKSTEAKSILAAKREHETGLQELRNTGAMDVARLRSRGSSSGGSTSRSGAKLTTLMNQRDDVMSDLNMPKDSKDRLIAQYDNLIEKERIKQGYGPSEEQPSDRATEIASEIDAAINANTLPKSSLPVELERPETARRIAEKAKSMGVNVDYKAIVQQLHKRTAAEVIEAIIRRSMMVRDTGTNYQWRSGNQ
jgi:hypothetical protein